MEITFKPLNGSPRVLLAMSGGVDSTVAALLLQKKGYEVVGLTMRFWVDPCTCREEQDVGKETGRIAETLGLEHHVVDLRDEFSLAVVDPFKEEYLSGRTPNPCVICNRQIKFSVLLREAGLRNAEFIATGHYAKNYFDPETGLFRLFKADDSGKDQSYMLYRLTQEELAKTIFPLGGLLKKEVRSIAEEAGLLVAGKKESQEICFIPDNDYRAFLRRHTSSAFEPGEIRNIDGTVLGVHRGLAFYTVGQRKGLGLTSPEPLYVVALDRGKNRVIVGKEEDLYIAGLRAVSISFVSGLLPDKITDVTVKIRYRAVAVPAKIFPPEGDRITVVFQEKQKAVTPGQSAVFYRGNEVIGGGIIDEPLHDF